MDDAQPLADTRYIVDLLRVPIWRPSKPSIHGPLGEIATCVGYIAVLLLLAVSAAGADECERVAFEATMTSVRPDLENYIQPGDTVRGFYGFDPAAGDSDPDNTRGLYSASCEAGFDVGDYSGSASRTTIWVEDLSSESAGDRYRAVLTNLVEETPISGGFLFSVDITLTDPSATVYDSDALPSDPPDLADFANGGRFRIGWIPDGSGVGYSYATITSITYGPEPLRGAVVDADGSSLIPPGHSGAIFDSVTALLWLDATETLNRSLADVQSELGPGGEFEGWQIATRAQIHRLFVDANLPITKPGLGWVQDLASQTRAQAFASIYGQTFITAEIVGTFLWHANTFDSPEKFASETAAWRTTDDGYWVGDNGIDEGWEGTVHSSFGVALVRPVSGVSENLLFNPGFDTDLSGWGNLGFTSWSSEDAGGSAASGSARLDLSGADAYYAIQSNCVTALPGEEFFYSASYLIPFAQQATGEAILQVNWFSQGDCSGVNLGADSRVGTQTAWTTIGNRVVAPAGTASVRVHPFNHKSGGTGIFQVYFDDAELVRAPEPSGGGAVAMASLVMLRYWRRRERKFSRFRGSQSKR
jgi:hypothetical protein